MARSRRRRAVRLGVITLLECSLLLLLSHKRIRCRDRSQPFVDLVIGQLILAGVTHVAESSSASSAGEFPLNDAFPMERDSGDKRSETSVLFAGRR